MRRKTSSPRGQKRKPVEIDDGGAFARQFREMMRDLFREAGFSPDPGKVVDLDLWRRRKKGLN